VFVNFTHSCRRSLFSNERQYSRHFWAKLNFKTQFCPLFISILLLFRISARRILFQGQQFILFVFVFKKKLRQRQRQPRRHCFLVKYFVLFIAMQDMSLLWLARQPIYWEHARTCPLLYIEAVSDFFHSLSNPLTFFPSSWLFYSFLSTFYIFYDWRGSITTARSWEC